jgi:mono/diheme cytochrome c family protein
MRMRMLRGSLVAGLVVIGAGLAAAQQAPLQVDAAAAKRGQSLFQNRGCIGCHSIGKGKRSGPDLAGVTQRRSLEWLRRWIQNPTPMFDTDSTAKALLAEFNNTRMPNLRLKDDEVDALLQYIQQESDKAGAAH